MEREKYAGMMLKNRHQEDARAGEGRRERQISAEYVAQSKHKEKSRAGQAKNMGGGKGVKTKRTQERKILYSNHTKRIYRSELWEAKAKTSNYTWWRSFKLMRVLRIAV